jgi:transketolase
MAAVKYGLDHLTAVIDRNGVQVDGTCAEIMPNDPFVDKWKAFGWHVLRVDGHDVKALVEAFEAARNVTGRPTMIVAETVKGKGVSFMEGQAKWHSGSVTPEQYDTAYSELSKELTK